MFTSNSPYKPRDKPFLHPFWVHGTHTLFIVVVVENINNEVLEKTTMFKDWLGHRVKCSLTSLTLFSPF